MILDDHSLEVGALDALDLLDPGTRDRFRHALGENHALAECVADFRDIAAEVALARSGPLQSPPVAALAGALRRIGVVPKPKTGVYLAFRAWWKVAAVAAMVVLLAAIAFRKGTSSREGDGALTGTDATDSPRTDENGTRLDQGEDGNLDRVGSNTLRELLDKLHRLERSGSAPGVIQDLKRLRGELESLKRADAERFAGGPRLSRTVVIEMVEPGTEPIEGGAAGDGLSERVGDYIAAGIGVETDVEKTESPAQSETPPEDKTPVVLEGGGVPDLDGTPEGVSVYYRDFPAGADAFERIDAGRIWDAENQRIWIETSEPGVYQAVPPPEGFDPDFPQDFADLIPTAGSLPPPVMPLKPPLESSHATPPETAPPNAQALAPIPGPLSPVAFSLYDETTGRGSVIVGNLGAPGAGNAYQLWMRDAGTDRYVSVGLLPTSSASVERFDFDLLGPGISPSEFMLTVEESSGAANPGSTVILHGP